MSEESKTSENVIEVIDLAKAYAATDQHEVQLRVFEQMRHAWNPSADAIRRMIADGSLQPGPVLGHGLQKVSVVHVRRQKYPGDAQVLVGLHPGDRHEAETFVIDAFQLVSQDSNQQFVESIGSLVAAGRTAGTGPTGCSPSHGRP